MKRFIILAALLLAFPAYGQSICAKRDALVEQLETGYGEHVVWQGLTTNDRLIELFQAEDGATWTLMISNADGTSCLIAAGKDAQSVKKDAPGTSL